MERGTWNSLTLRTTDIVENHIRIGFGPRKFDQDAERLVLVGQTKFFLHFGEPLFLIFIDLETRQYDPVHASSLARERLVVRGTSTTRCQHPHRVCRVQTLQVPRRLVERAQVRSSTPARFRARARSRFGIRNLPGLRYRASCRHLTFAAQDLAHSNLELPM